MSDEGVHFNKELDTRLKQQCQLYFEKKYDIEFLKIFRRNYLQEENMTQKERTLKYIEDFGSISSLEAFNDLGNI